MAKLYWQKGPNLTKNVIKSPKNALNSPFLFQNCGKKFQNQVRGSGAIVEIDSF